MKLNRNILFFLFFLLQFAAIKSQSCPSIKDVLGNEEVNVDCSYPFVNNKCINLSINFPSIKSTDIYNVNDISYPTTTDFQTGTQLANRDDEYLERIDFSSAAIFGSIPFSFSFFGETQTSVIPSSNGFVSFNTVYNEGDFSTSQIIGRTIPSTYLPSKSVFGVFQDLDFLDNLGKVSYRVEGIAPCRKLIFNFYNGRISKTTQRTTSQIILHELSNEIEVIVENKPSPNTTATMRESVIGITDANGNGLSPANRNTGVWSANTEAYRFSPNGATVSPSVINWYSNLSSGSFAQGNSVTYCTQDFDTVKATATYIINGNVITYSDQISIKFNISYPQTNNYVENLCSGSSSVLFQSQFNPKLTSHTDLSNFVFKYYNTFADAQNTLLTPISDTLPLNSNQDYYIRVENRNNPSCYTIAKLSFLKPLNILINKSVDICDVNNDGVEKNYLLNLLRCQLFPTTFTSAVKYLMNGVEVQSADITSSTTFFVSYNDPLCNTVTFGPISVNFTTAPTVVLPTPVFISDLELCDIIAFNNQEFLEPFEWEDELKERGIIFSTDPNIVKVSIFETENNAKNNVGEINFIREGTANNAYTYDLFARIDYASTDVCKGSCYSIVKFSATVKFNKIILNVSDNDFDIVEDSPTVYDHEDANVYLCETNQDVSVNLKDDADKIIKLIFPAANTITVTYHESLADAIDTDSSGLLNLDVVIQDALTAKAYFVRYLFGEECYVIKNLIYSVINPIVEKKEIEVCDNNKITSKIITLSDYDYQILGDIQWSQNPKPKVLYFEDFDLTKPITQLSVINTPTKVWVVVDSQLVNSCATQKTEVSFFLTTLGEVFKDNVDIKFNCDNLSDGTEKINLNDYLSLVFTGNASDYVLTWYNSNDQQINPDITITSNVTYFLKVTKTFGNCNKKVNFNFIIDYAANPQILLEKSAPVLRCNVNNLQFVTFDLTEAIPFLYSKNNTAQYSDLITSVRFYDSFQKAEIGDASDQITNPSNYQLASSFPTQKLYARFESKYGCYNIAEVNIKILSSIKFFSSTILHPICDDNLDGVYTINLRDWVISRTQDADSTNNLLSDSDANLLAKYTFYKNGVMLTAAEEQNYIADNNPITITAEIEGGCFDEMTINFNLQPFSSINLSAEYCDITNDSIEIIDLTKITQPLIISGETFDYYLSFKDLNLGTNKITDPVNYSYNETSGSYKIYVKVSSSTSCSYLAILTIVLKKTPIFNIADIFVCPKELVPTVQPNVISLNVTSYLWKNASGNTISNTNSASNLGAGKYSLTITSTNGCDYTDYFEIIEKELPVITELIAINNSYKVIATGSKKILYSRDNINWQESNLFENIPKGIITFYVRFENDNCIGETKKGIILDIINTFTPNGDGVNDIWYIKDTIFFGTEKSELKVFDRFGNLLYVQNTSGVISWDGSSNGRILPTTSYWFVLKIPDGRSFSGWVLLKNRN